MIPNPAKKLLEEVIGLCNEEKVKGSPYYKVETHGIPPKELRVFECPSADWERGQCDLPATKAWKWKEGRIEDITPSEWPDWKDRPNGMYWDIGAIQFWIDEEERRAVYTFTLGPRYGRGFRTEFSDSNAIEFKTSRDQLVWMS